MLLIQNPRKPAEPAMGTPAINLTPLRGTAIPLVDNSADVTPVTVHDV